MSIIKRLRGKQQQTTGLLADLGSDASSAPTPQPKAKSSLFGMFGPKAKKEGTAHRSKPVDASTAELFADENGQVLVAFGMRWRTMVKAGGKEAAQQLALKAGSTHYLLVQHQVAYTKVRKDIERPIYPAALLLAKSNAGAGVYCLMLSPDDGRYWFATVRAGAPAGTDEVVTGLSQPDAVARIKALVEQFGSDVPAVFSDIRQSGITGQRSFSLHDVFDIVRSESDRLVKIKKGNGNVPKPLLITSGVAVLLLGAQKGWDAYSAMKRREALEASRVADISPEEAWAPVVQKFEQAHAVAGVDALAQVRQSMGNMPALWMGWKLISARCQAGDMASGKQVWLCQSTYERTGVGATAKEMSEHISSSSYKSVAIGFPTSNTMMATWTLGIQAQTIKVADLLSTKDVTVETISALQIAFPTLAMRPEFKLSELQLPAPKKQDGSLQPKPESIPRLFSGELTVKGPLRSIDALAPSLKHIAWDAIGMQVEPFTDSGQKGMTASAIVVEATGKAIAKEIKK